MNIDIKVDGNVVICVFWACLASIILTLITMVAWHDRLDLASDAKIQLAMVEKGYTPSEIACAWNINQPACLVKEVKNDNTRN